MKKTGMFGKKFYEKTLTIKHHPRTESAVVADKTRLQKAIDCGCGTGADMAYIAQAGYQVSGFDVTFDAIEICQQRFKDSTAIKVTQASFESFTYPQTSLIIANASLFFAQPESFQQTWLKLISNLVSGGVFAGDFMGLKDDWARGHSSPITALSKDQVMMLFEDFDLLEFHERDETGETRVGVSKHWHTYSVIAIKKLTFSMQSKDLKVEK